MNDSYANDPQVRRALGAPRVTVHPEDARALGLDDQVYGVLPEY
jgi:hypothetical protein